MSDAGVIHIRRCGDHMQGLVMYGDVGTTCKGYPCLDMSDSQARMIHIRVCGSHMQGLYMYGHVGLHARVGYSYPRM